MAADRRTWDWIGRTFRLPPVGRYLLYVGFAFYGLGRMIAWFIHARLDDDASFEFGWGGPSWVKGNDLSDAGWLEVLVRTSIGGVLFAAFLWLCWVLFIRRLWERADEPTEVPT